MNILTWLFILALPTALVLGNCGCGSRCLHYSTPNECSRCCGSIVRRSLDAPIRVFDRFLPAPVKVPVAMTIPRDLKQTLPGGFVRLDKSESRQLSNLISRLYMDEFRAKNAEQKATLRRARSKLQHYRKLKTAGDVSGTDASNKEMYDLLEMVLKRLRSRERNSTRRFS